MREATVTKKNAQITTITAAQSRTPSGRDAPNTCGTAPITNANTTAPQPTTANGKSRSVRGTSRGSAPNRSFICFAPIRKLATITGMLRKRVIRPAAATAPAPM